MKRFLFFLICSILAWIILVSCEERKKEKIECATYEVHFIDGSNTEMHLCNPWMQDGDLFTKKEKEEEKGGCGCSVNSNPSTAVASGVKFYKKI